MPQRARLRHDQPGLVRQHDGLHPVAETQLGQHPTDVGLHRALLDHEAAGDLPVGESLGDQPQHVELPGRQRGQPLGHGGRGGGRGPQRPGEGADQTPGDGGIDQRVTGRHRPDRADQLLGRGVLEQEAAGPSAERLVDVLVGVEGGQDQHPGGGPGQHRPGRLQTVQPRHPDVHQHHVGLERHRPLDRLHPVGRLPHHVDATGGADDHPEARPYETLVVGDQEADR